MRRKNQRIPDSIWAKLIEIWNLKEHSWNLTTIVNECINTGANWWIKKLKKDLNIKDEKEAGTKSPDKPASENNDTPDLPSPTNKEIDQMLDEVLNQHEQNRKMP